MPQRLPVELIAMDMDGTLLNEAQQISRENRKALARAAELGVRLAICSGRTADDVSYFLSDAGIAHCAVLALNGACCLAEPHGRPYAVHTLGDETLEKTTAILLERRVTFACFQQRRVIVLNNDPQATRANWGTYVARADAANYACGEEALARFRQEGVCKIVYIDRTDGEPRIDAIRRELLRVAGLTVTSSWADNLELMPEGVSKGTALTELAQRLSIPRERVMAIGDYDNDLDMIRAAGIGVAMGNASESVKRAANHVTLANGRNGVAAAIRRFALAK
jgi:Cof subfamily protein (haloacid dehalogenase superfamily)